LKKKTAPKAVKSLTPPAQPDTAEPLKIEIWPIEKIIPYARNARIVSEHFRNAFIAQPWKLQSCLIWKKGVLVMGRADYHWIHEPILYGWKEGAAHVYLGDRKQTTVWEIQTEHQNKAESDTGGVYVHPTQKPVALIEKALRNSSAADDTVLDLFGGSGSTLIACEKTQRKALLMELDPKYVDVIVQRWMAFRGAEATLESTGETFAQVKALRTTTTVQTPPGRPEPVNAKTARAVKPAPVVAMLQILPKPA
jgi:DNA modification methylase